MSAPVLRSGKEFVMCKGLFICLRSNKIISYKTMSWCESIKLEGKFYLAADTYPVQDILVRSFKRSLLT